MASGLNWQAGLKWSAGQNGQRANGQRVKMVSELKWPSGLNCRCVEMAKRVEIVNRVKMASGLRCPASLNCHWAKIAKRVKMARV